MASWDPDRTDVVLLRELRFDGTAALVTEGELHEFGPVAGQCHNHYRLYLKREGDSGTFCCVQFVSCRGGSSNVWDDPDVEVTILFEGWAAFDGVRHLWFTPDSDCKSGYLHYPDLATLGFILTRLKELFPER